MTEPVLFPSSDAASHALLSYLGSPLVEKMVNPSVTVRDLSDGMRQFAPAILQLPSGEAIALLAPGKVLNTEGRPSLSTSWKQVKAVWEDPAFEAEREVFQNVPASRKALDLLIAERVSAKPAGRVIQFVCTPSARFSEQLRTAGWWTRLSKVMLAHAAAYAATLAGAAMLGRGALNGSWDPGWFWGWVTLLAVSIPLFAYSGFGLAWLVIAFGGMLKQRLLAGTLAIHIDRISKQGVGRLLTDAIEAEVLELSMLGGGSQTLLALLEVAAAIFLLTQGAAPVLLSGLFAFWVALTILAMYRYIPIVERWVNARTALTQNTIEKMNGHRTRIAQQPASLWHADEDEQLRNYARVSVPFDRWQGTLVAVVPRGWLCAGSLVAGIEFIAGGTRGAVQPMASAIFGVLLGMVALRHLLWGLGQLLASRQAWNVARDLFEAAGDQKPEPRDFAVVSSGNVLEARDVSFRYPGLDRDVLAGCNLVIRPGDRVLIEGASGSGKSTLGNVIAGLHPATGGLVLTQGLDLATAGPSRWRKQVATAPQYHQNHILAATLLFNLLIGRNWPLQAGDAQEAAAVCEELGLGPLLERMPAGMMEQVGETGWQLSQGERSRVFLARAILQQAPLVILDESFAALDPETLEQCLRCVLKRAPSLLVIAHP
jgi:ATP-binding cassette, subfamily B, bacterial